MTHRSMFISWASICHAIQIFKNWKIAHENYGTIWEDDEVHEALKDAIFFYGKIYEVLLPRKEGHWPLPSNYQNTV